MPTCENHSVYHFDMLMLISTDQLTAIRIHPLDLFTFIERRLKILMSPSTERQDAIHPEDWERASNC